MTDAPRLDRRAVLGCAAALGVAGPILVACSSPSADDGGQDGPGSAAGSAKAGDLLVPTADVPVGGGVAMTDLGVVVTQPAKGEFKAYSSVCTHQGGAITQVEGGDMICSLHHSHFAIDDGDVVSGPAPRPLPEVKIKIAGDQIVRA